MSFHTAPQDARRGGLVILGADADCGPRLGMLYAGSGYETLVADIDDDPAALISELAAPVFILGLADAATIAWEMTGVVAISIVADGRISAAVEHPLRVPAILHLDPSAHAELASAFEAAQPDLPVHIRLDTADSERLLHLRTLRLFSAKAGGPGEV